MKTAALISAVITVLIPIISQKSGLSKKHGFPLKMLSACLYLVTGVISAVSFGELTQYSVMMLGGLLFGILGDFFLEYKSKKLFPLGAVFFALGHIVYSVTFLFIGDCSAVSYIWAVLLMTVAVTAVIFAFAKRKLHLKGKKKFIVIYAPVLIFSFACAVVKGAVALSLGSFAFGLCLIWGGSMFFASDIMIGVGKGGVKRPPFLHYAVSYTYFAAQTLFALSILFQ
jgi:uncharacterized membrane protein YhhN